MFYRFSNRYNDSNLTKRLVTLEQKLTTTVRGPTGPQGPIGEDSTVEGPTGSQGPAGANGADSTVEGPTGAQGPTGASGADSTVEGPTGAQGPTGASGADSTVEGPTGAQGPTGPSVEIPSTLSLNQLTCTGQTVLYPHLHVGVNPIVTNNGDNTAASFTWDASQGNFAVVTSDLPLKCTFTNLHLFAQNGYREVPLRVLIYGEGYITSAFTFDGTSETQLNLKIDGSVQGINTAGANALLQDLSLYHVNTTLPISCFSSIRVFTDYGP